MVRVIASGLVVVVVFGWPGEGIGMGLGLGIGRARKMEQREMGNRLPQWAQALGGARAGGSSWDGRLGIPGQIKTGDCEWREPSFSAPGRATHDRPPRGLRPLTALESGTRQHAQHAPPRGHPPSGASSPPSAVAGVGGVHRGAAGMQRGKALAQQALAGAL